MAIIVRRENPLQFTDYQGYKHYLRRDFSYRCVYCSIHEREHGGYRSFHVDHFRPKSKFPALVTTYTNLMYACNFCNENKGDYWHTPEEQAQGLYFLDPCEEDYDCHFRMEEFILVGLSSPARFMCRHLRLNRTQLRNLRRDRREKTQRFERALAVWSELAQRTESARQRALAGGESALAESLGRERDRYMRKIEEIQREKDEHERPPYEPEDLR